MNACGHHHVGHIGILGVDKNGEEWYQIEIGGNQGETHPGGLGPRLGKVIGPAFARADVPNVIERTGRRGLRTPARRSTAVGRGAAAFLARFGHRGISEGELATRTWADDPAPVLASLTSLARNRGIARTAATERRRADEAALLSAAGLIGGAVLRRAIAEAQDGVRRREHTKSLAIRFIARARRLARRTGAALAADGRLRQADDVFFLTLSELQAADSGITVPAPEIARRKRRHARAGAAPVPREVDLAGVRAVPVPADGALTGIAVSAGIGVGPARVLRPGEPPSIADGEVLVAPVLDAAYGPLLASAAAAVAEMGGLLSHGAVVARELGVPCVVDVREATRRIRTGQTVRVNGGTGLVEVLEEQSQAADRAERTLPPPTPPTRCSMRGKTIPSPGRACTSMCRTPPRASPWLLPPACGATAVRRRCSRSRCGRARSSSPSIARRRAGCRYALAVRGLEVGFSPLRLSFDGRLAAHRGAFPPGAIPLLLTPREVPVRIDLRFSPTTPAIDFCRGLPDDVREALTPLGAHHVEQSGAWTGDHRDRRAHVARGRHRQPRPHVGTAGLERGRLVAALHDAAGRRRRRARARGERAGPGGGRRVRVARRPRRAHRARPVRAPSRGGCAARAWSSRSPPRAAALRIHGEVERSITVPVDLDRRLHRHLSGRPWRLLLDENFTRYEGLGPERPRHGRDHERRRWRARDRVRRPVAPDPRRAGGVLLAFRHARARWARAAPRARCSALAAYGFALEAIAIAVFASHRYDASWRLAPLGVPLAVGAACGRR